MNRSTKYRQCPEVQETLEVLQGRAQKCATIGGAGCPCAAGGKEQTIEEVKILTGLLASKAALLNLPR